MAFLSLKDICWLEAHQSQDVCLPPNLGRVSLSYLLSACLRSAHHVLIFVSFLEDVEAGLGHLKHLYPPLRDSSLLKCGIVCSDVRKTSTTPMHNRIQVQTFKTNRFIVTILKECFVCSCMHMWT